MNALREDKIGLNGRIKQLEDELTELKNERGRMQGDLSVEISRLKKQLQELEYSSEERIRLLKREHTEQLEALEGQWKVKLADELRRAREDADERCAKL